MSSHRSLVRFGRSIRGPIPCCLLVALLTGSGHGQVFERPGALPPAEVEQLDANSAAHLENAKRFLVQGQWNEAVESIRRVQEAEPGRLVRVDLAQTAAGYERYVTAGEYCQWRLASLAAEAPEALAHYRQLVDGLADAWLRDGEKTNNEAVLRRVAQQTFASRAGDDALLRLGDIALARGDHTAARGAWQRIDATFSVSPSSAAALRAAAGTPLWLALRKFDFARHGADLLPYLSPPQPQPWESYPDTDLDSASIQARLVLASIMEGSPERANVELALLRLLHPDAVGFLAGRRGRYADSLQSLLEESAGWPARRQSPDWPTFGGSWMRGKVIPDEIAMVSEPLWSYPLPRLSADRESIGAGRLRVAEDSKSLLSYHPIVVGQQVLLRIDARGNSYVVALDLKTGRRLWQVDYGRGIAPPMTNEPAPSDEPPPMNDSHTGLARHIGVARYTASAWGNKLIARMGSSVTVPTSRRAALWLAKDQGFLLGLDLASQGRPLEGFPIRPPSNEWTFEGVPICDGGAVYTAMRRVEGARSQLYLSAFELQTAPISQVDHADDNGRPAGRLKWQTRICSSATAGGGDVDELTHLLVTLDGDRLFLNTSSGAVAAVSADDGRVLWLTKYPRSGVRNGTSDQPEQHLFRDLTPCLATKDLVIVAPADCDRIFALEAMTGRLAWTLPPGACDDVVHLLGAMDDTLLASGNSLYWIDVNSGRLLAQFPPGKLGGPEQAAPAPRGFGRGLIAGNHIWWPTRESILVFEARPMATDFGFQPRLVREIPLFPRGAGGGNLVLAGGVLLIATGDRLVALGDRRIQ